jgi:hypothetical protein
MKNCAGVVGLILVTAGVASGQSLGEVARQEQARRKAVKASGKIYTNDSLRAERAPASPTAPPEAPTPPPATPTTAPGRTTASSASAAATDPAKAGGAAQGAQNDEAAWRKRIEGARTAVSRAQSFQAALQSQINGLNADFTARDNPIERNAIAAERQKALAELERVKQEVADGQKNIADIQEEARRAGVPAGWVR